MELKYECKYGTGPRQWSRDTYTTQVQQHKYITDIILEKYYGIFFCTKRDLQAWNQHRHSSMKLRQAKV